MMTKQEELVLKLENILDPTQEDVASVLKILNDHEINRLLEEFHDLDGKRKTVDLEETKIKANTVSSIIIFLLNNPQVSKALQKDKDGAQNTIMLKLYGTAYELYKTLYETNGITDQVEKMRILVLLSLNAVLADRTAEIDCYIRNKLLDLDKQNIQNVTQLDNLEVKTYHLTLNLLKNIRRASDLKALRKNVDECKELLAMLQQGADKDDVNLSIGFAIVGFANIIYALQSTGEYLFEGKTSSGENVQAIIDTHTYNALSLFEYAENESLNKISYLLKFSLNQICRNSIWRIVGKSPNIGKFLQRCIKSEENVIYSMLPSQRDSILDVLTTRKSIVLNMPTSSGKTLLAELYILFTMHNFTDKNFKPTVCYIVPTNALLNQTKKKLTAEFDGFDFSIESALPFYDIDEIENEALTYKHIDILISTPEKMDLLIRRNHESLKNLKLLIMDEAHNLADNSRGAKFELLLSTIKQHRDDVNYLLLSPFIENAEQIAEWLGDTDSIDINIEWTPTKQFVGCNLLKNSKEKSVIRYFPTPRNNIVDEIFDIDLHANLSNIKKTLKEDSINYVVKCVSVIEKYINIGNVLVLCKGPGSTQNIALGCLEYLKEKLENISHIEDVKRVTRLIQLESDNDELIKCLQYGIVYHHSQLSPLVKEEIENLIGKDFIKIVCATTTLAHGMNFPVTTVIFEALQLGSGKNSVKIDHPTFWNIAGRAGRAFMDTEGHAIILSQGSQKKTVDIAKYYIKQDIKAISSSLKSFFDKMDSSEIDFNYSLLKNNATISNFLQYLSHIIKVSYNYDFDKLDVTKIQGILNHSFVYRELEFQKGFIESQQRIRLFSSKYIDYLKNQNKEYLKLADVMGVSNISLNTIYAMIKEYEKEIIAVFGQDKSGENLKASNIILNSRDPQKLGRIIDIISKLPELKLYIVGKGHINPESIAKIIIGWVNGKSIMDIAKDIKYEEEPLKDVLAMCNNYIGGRLKTYVPWGVSIYQTLTSDNADENSKNLATYIYYGVSDKKSAVLSMLGVPRFAVSHIKAEYERRFPKDELDVKDGENIKKRIKEFDEKCYSFAGKDLKVVKGVVDNYL